MWSDLGQKQWEWREVDGVKNCGRRRNWRDMWLFGCGNQVKKGVEDFWFGQQTAAPLIEMRLFRSRWGFWMEAMASSERVDFEESVRYPTWKCLASSCLVQERTLNRTCSGGWSVYWGQKRGSGTVLDPRTKVRRRDLQLRELTVWWGKQIIKRYYHTMDIFLNWSDGVDPRGWRNWGWEMTPKVRTKTGDSQGVGGGARKERVEQLGKYFLIHLTQRQNNWL